MTPLETSTDVFSETTTSEATATATSDVKTTATTSNTEIITTAKSDAQTTATSEITNTATSNGEITTAAELTTATTSGTETTITSEAESTTTAPAAAPTFKVVGGGAVNGALLQGLDNEGSQVMFNPNYPLNHFQPRTYILEPSGRIKDKDAGYYLCGYYDSTGVISPANIATCIGTPGSDTQVEYMKCQILNGKPSCTVPQTV
ncbi:hypothetical protein F53441_12136 [Fusarium austroafricanum]|uniref:Uncharacterized protein n=1 Tax=Fusarium austroafricanum TaxID=2364996 RepID=A0A8H4NX70_9HYPO|nr:hypothetical protein F53441_12136 [Fusarium austroafricanum]